MADSTKRSLGGIENMTETAHHTSHSLQIIHGLAHDQVADFIKDQQKNRGLTALIKQLNTTLLSGTADQRKAAQIALEKLGFVDV